MDKEAKYVEAIRLLNDGHITIIGFTTGWKAIAGTPDLTLEARKAIEKLPTFCRLEDALKYALKNEYRETFDTYTTGRNK